MNAFERMMARGDEKREVKGEAVALLQDAIDWLNRDLPLLRPDSRKTDGEEKDLSNVQRGA